MASLELKGTFRLLENRGLFPIPDTTFLFYSSSELYMTLPKANGLPRCKFGVNGLDDILVGGLPRNRLYLLQGAPGVGKTTLALQFLLTGVKEGDRVFYIALSETKEELQQIASSHGWSLDGIEILELADVEKQLDTLAQDTLFRPSEVDLNRTAEFLIREIQRVKPARIVLDSLAEFRLMAETALRYRRQILALKQFLATQNATVILLDDSVGERDLQVQSVAHGAILMEMVPFEFGTERRRLKISKLRGLNFRHGYHDFILEPGGLQVFPRLVAAEHFRDFPDAKLASGICGLDDILAGGLDAGTSNLFIGPAGTGKSSLSMRFVTCAASMGHKCLFYTFDENLKVLLKRSESLGMKVQPHLDSGAIRLQQIDPGGLTPGQFVDEIVAEVRKGARVVVVDSLNGYMNAMPNERFLSIQLHELLTFLGQQGVVSILTLAQQGMMGPMNSPVDLTYLADTVVLLRFFEAMGRVKKAISVTKKRSGRHEDAIREYRLTSSGIQVGEPLTEFHGVLTGVPTFTGAADKMLKLDESRRRL